MAPPASVPPVPLFPPAPRDALKKSPKLNDAVNAAVDAIVSARSGKPPARFALSLIDLAHAGPATFAYGGYNDDQEHYAASVVKIGVMYAAYAMLGMVNRYNELRAPSSPKALFDGLRKELSGAIEQSSKTILGGVGARFRTPSYERVFAAAKVGSKVVIRFQQRYVKAMEDMIIPSSNEQTAECIHGLGYSYLNGALEKGGFFRSSDRSSTDRRGMWIGGDFTGAWPYVRIPCDNDIDTAQGATSRSLAHLMAVIVLDDILSHASHIEMGNLLKRSAHGADSSFLLRPVFRNRLTESQVTHAKIGLGPLKQKSGGGNVISEATKLVGLDGSGRHYVAAFTNLDQKTYGVEHVIAAIKDAVRRYEA